MIQITRNSIIPLDGRVASEHKQQENSGTAPARQLSCSSLPVVLSALLSIGVLNWWDRAAAKEAPSHMRMQMTYVARFCGCKLEWKRCVSKRVEGGLLRGGSDQPHENADDVGYRVLQVRMEVCRLKCGG